MGPVIGLNGGEDGFSTDRTWHRSSVVPRPRQARRGHKRAAGWRGEEPKAIMLRMGGLMVVMTGIVLALLYWLPGHG